MSRSTCHWMAFSFLSLVLFSGETSATTMPCKGCNGPVPPPPVSSTPQGLYLGIFGGGGSLTNTHISQRGTAFYPETSSVGGPLAVDADGHVGSHSTGFIGAHFGYAWNQAWCSLTPAIELEGFYMRSRLDGTLDAPHTALPEHAFSDSFPTRSGVFLINSVFTLNNLTYPQVHLYLGGGIGGGVVSVSGADSLQVRPPEPNVNHFNTETDASSSTFAAQLKAGLSYSLTNCFSVFAEYRLLYLGPTRYNFGSTVYPGHVPTAPWGVNVDGMYYNLGAVGIQFNV